MGNRSVFNRRRLLQGFLAAGAGGAFGASAVRRQAYAAGDGKPRFLIVIGAFGGGAIIDSFLPVRAADSGNAESIDCFPDDQIVTYGDSPIRAVDAVTEFSPFFGPNTPLPLSWFTDKYRHQMMVTTLEGSSVNHAVAQHRALTGGGSALNGRTLQECTALAYGAGHPLPNVNMASGGLLENGFDGSIDATFRAEPIPAPLLKPLTFSGTKGLPGAPNDAVMAIARDLRDTELDPHSSFHQTFRNSPRVALWKEQRQKARSLEAEGLIDKLLFVADSPQVPISAHGLSTAPEYQRLVQLFPSISAPLSDPLEEQAALACLLLKNRVSVAVTISPGFSPVLGGPYNVKTAVLAFDASHQNHRAAQALMWNRVLKIADGVIQFLSETIFDEATGETFWDRSLVYFASDFGRDKTRPTGASVWGTGHNLNNGHLVVSPFANGNAVLGGVDPDTGLTYGFDLATGQADPGRKTTEIESFAGIAQALGIETGSLPDVPAMRKG
ncbi:MAG: hypothetical protein JNL21_07430 [Myxococcales bacterium]|nr:hypothetical protein [Myxococcales bacterium]